MEKLWGRLTGKTRQNNPEMTKIVNKKEEDQEEKDQKNQVVASCVNTDI